MKHSCDTFITTCEDYMAVIDDAFIQVGELQGIYEEMILIDFKCCGSKNELATLTHTAIPQSKKIVEIFDILFYCFDASFYSTCAELAKLTTIRGQADACYLRSSIELFEEADLNDHEDLCFVLDTIRFNSEIVDRLLSRVHMLHDNLICKEVR